MDYFIGTIIPWSGSYEPYGWYYCDGRQMPITRWNILYSVIGLRYGGDGQTYFNLPNLNGRVAVGSMNTIATSGGTETVTLHINELPSHGHSIKANTNLSIAGASIPDSTKVPGVSKAGLGATQLYKQFTTPTDLVPLNSNTLNYSGTQGSHTNLQPYLAMKYIICVEGDYPIRP